MKPTNFRLLTIDGGGIRGIVPAVILAYIEARVQKPIHQLFDAVAGTSTGGILALGLLKPGAGVGRAAELVELYLRDGPKIFKRTIWDRVLSLPAVLADKLEDYGLPRGFDLNDLGRPRYGATGRRQVLQAFFGETQLREALLPLFVTSYDTELRCPVFFVSRAEHENTGDDYYEATAATTMADAAMATSAAPTYFPPHRIARPGGHYSLVDGAMFANNPTGIAHSFMRGAHYDGDAILSLGTGSMQHAYPFERVAGWGLLGWAGPVLKMTFDGQTEAVSVAMRRRLSTTSYLRIQGFLEDGGASDDLDDLRDANLAKLQELARTLIAKNAKQLDSLCEILLAAS